MKARLWWVVLGVVLAVSTKSARAEVTFESVGSVRVSDDTNLAALTIPAFTCTNADTALFVTAHIRETSTTQIQVTNITYNGLTFASFTKVGSEVTPNSGNQIISIAIWRALPGTACDGAAHDMVVTIGTNKQWGVGVMSLTGVNQVDPEDVAQSAETNGTTAANPTLSGIVSETGDMVLGYVGRRATDSLTSAGGQTARYNLLTGAVTASSAIRLAGATAPGAATVQIQWTQAVAQEWVVLAINVNAASGRRRMIPPHQFMGEFRTRTVENRSVQ